MPYNKKILPVAKGVFSVSRRGYGGDRPPHTEPRFSFLFYYFNTAVILIITEKYSTLRLFWKHFGFI